MYRILIRKLFHHRSVIRIFSPSSQRLLNVPLEKNSTLYGRTSLFSLCGLSQFVYLHSSAICQKKKNLKPNPVNHNLLKKIKTPVVSVWKNMTVRELAEAVGRDVDIVCEIILEVSSVYYKPNSPIDDVQVIKDTVKKAGFRCSIQTTPKLVENEKNEKNEKNENKDAIRRPPPLESELVKKPPVVTIMGHVDHGKTTLLDSLRQSSIVDTEFGGITQHIGAFSVKLEGEQVTFLDTPGHAAFKAMRARGANVTDLVVLVVAADDGVMHQTRESVELAQDAGVPIIVAINKIDKPDADVKHCQDMLLNCGLQLEEQGGDIQAVPISALKGENIDNLIEALVAQAELLNLRADPRGLVEASTIESRIDPGRGKVATCIIQRGTLRKGAILVAGTAWAKVRGMFLDSGEPLKEAPPATPVQIIGWRDLPEAGDLVLEVESERRAAEVITWRKLESSLKKQEEAEVIIEQKRNDHLKVYKKALEERQSQGIKYSRNNERVVTTEDSSPRVSIVLKGDVDGSVEAILDVLDSYHSSDCQLHILSYGVGPVTPSDVTMAAAFQGTIYSFNVETPRDVQNLAISQKVTIKKNNIIYRLIEDLQKEISSKLPLKTVEEILGEADVLAEFMVTEGKKKIPVAGCRCIKGVLKKDAKFRVIRNQDIIHEGKLESMRHHKSEVKSVSKEKECGLMFQDEEVQFKPGDTILCYTENRVEQVSDWDPGF